MQTHNNVRERTSCEIWNCS